MSSGPRGGQCGSLATGTADPLDPQQLGLRRPQHLPPRAASADAVARGLGNPRRCGSPSALPSKVKKVAWNKDKDLVTRRWKEKRFKAGVTRRASRRG
mmetsp:Transcript_49061/g.124503  ORF Transcript_49061/g.124503 Transcript_49061/m.124503 type:complete len:98 (-) Transcript_49061:111-404(-)